MRGELALRVSAIAIAVAGVADPSLTREKVVPRSVAIIVLDDPRLPSAAWSSVGELRSNLASDYDVAVRVHPQTATAAACPADGGCIVISNGSTPAQMTSGADVIGALRVAATGRPSRIQAVVVAPTVSLNGAASMEIQLGRRGADPAEVRVFDGTTLVGQARVDGAQDTASSVRLEWIPVASGPRRLRVVVGAADTARVDDEVDVGVDVRGEPAAVVTYEPEATWLGTFVRRALTADSRLRVDARTRLAPAITIGAAGGDGLTAETLADAGVAVVSAPESLSAAEIDLLDRFARVRGGSVVLLLDRRPTGAVLRLMPPVRGERREADARSVGPLRASELLEFDASREGVAVLEAEGGRAAIVAMAVGRGRVITSGALDAWRYRGDDDTFERYWSSLIAAAADAAGRPLHIRVSHTLIAQGGDAELSVEWRSLDETGAQLTAQAEATCADGSRVPIRVWPGARPGSFTGRFSTTTLGPCTIQAHLTHPVQLAASTSVVVAERPRLLPRHPTALETAIAAHGGLVVSQGDEATLVARTRERLASQLEARPTKPMRSPWWVAPFAALLGAEWWLRRRRGLA